MSQERGQNEPEVTEEITRISTGYRTVRKKGSQESCKGNVRKKERQYSDHRKEKFKAQGASVLAHCSQIGSKAGRNT